MQYNFTKLLGKGSFGFVKEAENLDGKLIAVKIYKNNSIDVAAEIIREINTMKLINHPNIVKLLQVRVLGGNIEIAIQHGGISLSTYIYENSEFIRHKKASKLFNQMLLAVSYMHKIGVIHRDLKPDNILIKKNVIRICDFSISKKIIPCRKNAHTYKIGTNVYNAPELFGSKPKDYNNKIDIWALGCTFYEFLTKKVLFKGNTDLSIITSVIKVIQPTENEMHNAGLHEIRLPVYKNCNIFNIISDNKIQKLIQKMLIFDANTRINAQDALGILNLSTMNHNKSMVVKYNKNRYNNKFYVKSLDYIGVNKKNRAECINIIETMCTSEKQTFLLAVNIFDRYTCNKSVSQNLVNKNLDIITHVSCFIASKYIDLRPIHINQLQIFSADDIITWELRILKVLDFDICGPTILDIYRFTISNKISEDHWQVLCSWVKDSFICGKNAHDIRLLIKNTFI